MEKCQLKFASDETKGEFEGYASIFDSNDSVNDTMTPGTFAKSLEGRMPSMFINHDSRAIPVGDWTEMKEDDHGLFSKGRIDMNHIDGPSLYSAMKRGAMSGESVGFTATKEDYTMKKDGGREYHNLKLMEVSLCTFPCDDGARITGVKASDMDILETLRDCEDYLRESCGFSKSVAVALVSHIKNMARSESAKVADESLTDITQALAGWRGKFI